MAWSLSSDRSMFCAMRVALIVRPSASQRSGGDITQARFTQRGLQTVGVEAEILSALEPEIEGFDLAHIFGVFDPEICAAQLAACRRAGVAVALSPIWWDLYDFFGRSRACERILAGAPRRIVRRLDRLRNTETKKLFAARETRRYAVRIDTQRELMRQADVLLPNSAIEAHFYLHQLKLYDRPITIVHNPVDVPTLASDRPRAAVACVARIEQKKNQAMLLYALADCDVDVLLIGGSHEPPYLDLCKRWATPRTRFLGNLSHDEVVRTLASVAVHVLPSWAETPGIANLEAAAAGARIVVSNDGTECEYFGEQASYVDPTDPKAIRDAVLGQLSLPPRDSNDALMRRLHSFSTQMVGRRTLEGYRIALEQRVSRPGC